MYTPQELHYLLNLRLDRISTQVKPDLNFAEIDTILNEAQLKYIKKHFTSPTFAFERSEKASQNLSPLIIKYPTQPDVTTFIKHNNITEVVYSNFIFLPLYFISVRVEVEQCDATVPLKFVQHDDLTEALRDPFNKPGLEFFPYNYGMSSVNPNTSSLFIYSDKYNILKLKAEYIRVPDRVSLGTYTHLDGVQYPPTGLSVSEQAQDEVLDIAATLVATYIADTNPSLQSKLLTLNSNPNL